VSQFVMPAGAGIQSVGDDNNFKDLDPRFRGDDGVSPIMIQSPDGAGKDTEDQWLSILSL